MIFRAGLAEPLEKYFRLGKFLNRFGENQKSLEKRNDFWKIIKGLFEKYHTIYEKN